MCKVIAVANQKGGVGKTVTSVKFGVSLLGEGSLAMHISTLARSFHLKKD